MRTFLVTGGAGFIGSHIAEALVQRHDKVRVLDNLSTGHLSNLDPIRDRIEFVQGDLLDTETVERVVDDVDCIFHQAALASVPRSVKDPLATNAACVTGTLTLLDAARRAGVRRLIYAASSSAYGDQPFSSKRETDLPGPLSPYAVAKLAGEHYCRAFTATYGFETVAIRYFNVFGPRQDPNSPYSAVIPKFITAILSGKQPTVYGDGLQSRDFTYVENVVLGNLLAADAQGIDGQVFNVACGGNITLLELLESLNTLLKTDVKPIFEKPRPGDVRQSLADISRARKLLDYEPRVGLHEGLARSIAYYKQLVAEGG